MRLTLRNLLRFLDQTNLRSIERTRLEQLVDESEKAGTWIDRIRQLRRDANVGAPGVSCEDPSIKQVVAYVDSTMGEQETIDFESSILSSDSLLAEVASAHQIRQLLRVDPRSSVSIELRQAVYDLARETNKVDRLDRANRSSQVINAETEESFDSLESIALGMQDLPHVDGDPNALSPVSSLTGEVVANDDEMEDVKLPGLPNRAQRSRSVVALALLILIAAGLLGVVYWLGVQAGREGNQTADTAGNSIDNPGESGNPTAHQDGDLNKGSDSSNQDNNETSQMKGDDDDSATADQLPMGAKQTGQPNKATEPNETKIESDQVHKGGPDHVGPDLAGRASDDDELAATGLPLQPNINVEEGHEGATDQVGPIALDPKPPVAKVNQFDPTLLRLRKDDNQWVRVDPSHQLTGGTELLALPGTNGELDLNGLLTVNVIGPARFTLPPLDIASQANTLRPVYGKFIVSPLMADVDLIIVRGNHRYRMTFPIAEAEAHLEFYNYSQSGHDPRKEVLARYESFRITQGRMLLDKGDDSWLLQDSEQWFHSQSGVGSLSVDPIAGLVPKSSSPPRDYRTRLQETVTANFVDLHAQLGNEKSEKKSVGQYFTALKDDIRQERRFAALAWMAFTGNFDYVVDFFDEEKNRNYWRSAFQSIRDAVIQNPDYADSLFDRLAVAGPEAQPVLFELIIGYPQPELIAGKDKQLVQYLDHDFLPIRVLAIERIRQITGGIAYGFSAIAERKARRRIVEKQWKRALRKNELHDTGDPPLPVPVFESGATTDDQDPPVGRPEPADSVSEKTASKPGGGKTGENPYEQNDGQRKSEKLDDSKGSNRR